MKLYANFNHYASEAIAFYRESTLLTLNPQQKKVALAVVAVFAVLAIAAVVYFSKCFRATKTDDSKGQKSENISSKPKDKSPEEQKSQNLKNDQPIDLPQNESTTTTDALPNQTEIPPIDVLEEHENENQDSVVVTPTLLEIPQPIQQDQSETLPTEKMPEPKTEELLPPAPFLPTRQQIIDSFNPKMLEALGGIDAVANLPVIEDWTWSWRKDFENIEIKGPLMIGWRDPTKPFLLLSYWIRNEEGYFSTEPISATELLARGENGWSWMYNSLDQSPELTLGYDKVIPDDNPKEKYMLDRIKRLLNDESIGVVEHYPEYGLTIARPKVLQRPTDAYLKDDELTEYLTLNFDYYETVPQPGKKEIFLDLEKNS